MNNEQGGLRTVVCRFDAVASQSVAWFEDAPQVAFGADVPMEAARRLLTETDAAPVIYSLRIDWPPNMPILREFTWTSPDLRFPCHECRGNGEILGFAEKYKCCKCGGAGHLKG